MKAQARVKGDELHIQCETEKVVKGLASRPYGFALDVELDPELLQILTQIVGYAYLPSLAGTSQKYFNVKLTNKKVVVTFEILFNQENFNIMKSISKK